MIGLWRIPRARASSTSDRCARLVALVRVVRARLAESGKADLLFVCTHKSRRSHMAQLIGLAAVNRNGLGGVRTFSGGTEASAYDERVEQIGRDLAWVFADLSHS